MKIAATISVFIVLLFSIFIAGCGAKCDRPYKLIDDVCCTDENQNNVCDVEELETEKDESFEMKDATYDDKPTIAIPDPVIKEPDMATEPEEKVLYEAPKSKEPQEAEPVIDTRFDVKKSDIPAEGMKEAVPDHDTRMNFTVDNIIYGDGRIYRADLSVTNNMDIEVSPRIHIYGLRDGEYFKLYDVLFKPLKPGRTTVKEYEQINTELDKVDQTVKWELAYHSLQTGLVVVGSKETFLPKK